MVNLAIIGLGTIAQIQFQALLKLQDHYRVVAVCDLDEEKVRSAKKTLSPFGDVLGFSDLNELLALENVDAVLVSTPPKAHFSVVKAVIEAGKNVLLEKPATTSYLELTTLYELAEKRGVVLQIAYHGAFAKESLWFRHHGKDVVNACKGKKLIAIESEFYDDYMKDGKILPEKRGLGGCFLDNGINILSVVYEILPLIGYEITCREDKKEEGENGLIYHSDHVYESEENPCKVILHTGWDMGSNQKTTKLYYRGLNGYILLDHLNQEVVLVRDNVRTKLYSFTAYPRLIAQYMGVFCKFSTVLERKNNNKIKTLKIHSVLFE